MTTNLFRGINSFLRAIFGVQINRPPAEFKVPDFWGREFSEIYDMFKDHTMVPGQGLFTLYNAVKYLIANNVQGAFIECGVYQGGACGLIADTLRRQGITDREIYLFDTFAGMSKPTEFDFGAQDFDKFEKTAAYFEKKENSEFVDWCYGSIETVKTTMSKSQYPNSHIHYVVGKVEETLPKFPPTDVALLRLDTDWHESTKVELEYLYDLVVPNGVIIIDDYSAWAGSRKAASEFFTSKNIHPFLNFDYQYGAVTFIKNL